VRNARDFDSLQEAVRTTEADGLSLSLNYGNGRLVNGPLTRAVEGLWPAIWSYPVIPLVIPSEFRGS